MEKRSNTRVPFEVGAIVKYKRKTLKCNVTNLSLNGVLLKTEEKILKDTKVKVGIFMEGGSSKLMINLEGLVVRTGQSETALAFKSIDLDSFIHLKNIVAYNEGNEEKIMKEFYKKVKSSV